MGSLNSPQSREQGLEELARQREIARTNRPQREPGRTFGFRREEDERAHLDALARRRIGGRLRVVETGVRGKAVGTIERRIEAAD
jgi:hypothetical protein